jgi:hypothetical protein
MDKEKIQYTPPKGIVAAAKGAVGVYDSKGRLIRVLDRSPKANASGEVWDRTDAGGKKAAPGMYIIMSRSGSNINFQKVVRQ